MGESDFSGPFIVGFGLRPSRRGPCKTPQGQPRDIPVPEQGASAYASVYDDAEPTYVSRSRHGPYCLLQDGKHRHSEVGFRRSMAGLRYPLSTLRFAPHGSPRMTRGRCGSLCLHRRGLSPHTSCRSPGAPVHPIIPRWRGERGELTPCGQDRIERNGGRRRKTTIVALARKLLVALWKYVTGGVVIESAMPRPGAEWSGSQRPASAFRK